MRIFHRLLPGLLLLAACANEPTSPGDAGTSGDAGRVEDGSAEDAGADAGHRDSGADAGVDSGIRDAAVPDGSLAGTNLEGIQLAWREPIELCERWREGETLEEAANRKLQIRLEPAARTTLEPDALQAATLGRGTVKRGPFSSEQIVLDGAASTLTRWELIGQADPTLQAEIAHDLGPAGALIETLSIFRADGDRAPVDYAAPRYSEVFFTYEAPGREPETLTICGGPADLEDAAVVLHASNGTDWVTILREQRTALTPAGSAPVHPIRAEMVLSSAPPYSEVFQAAGHWSQTYTAAHHNWNEQSSIRYDRDLRWHYLVYGPLDAGETPTYPGSVPKEVSLAGVNTSGTPGTVTMTETELPSGNETVTSYDVEVDFTRVDRTALLRDLGVDCVAPEVRAFWGVDDAGNYLFQLGFCDGALSLLTPVYLPQRPSLAGRRFDERAISETTVDGGPGFEVDLGGGFLLLRPQSSGFAIKVLDGNGTELAATSVYETELFDYGFFGGTDGLVEAENAGAGVSVRVDRLWVGQGVGSSAIYAPISFELTFDGTRYRVDAWDRLDYTNTHHNWDDTLVAETDTLRLEWQVLGFGEVYQVRAERLSDGVEVLAPTEVR